MNSPNIVYILADDWGYGDVSCLNPESKIQTPCTDAFAKTGMTFTDAHSNSAVCTPTRYGVLAGRYAWRGRLKESVLQGYSRELIEHDRLTVPAMLKQAGYKTACIGKWHLGLGWQLPDGKLVDIELDGDKNPGVDFSKPLVHGPHSVGFDYSLILPASLDMEPYCYIENGRLIEQPTVQCETSPRPAFWRGGAIAPGVQHETSLLEFTRRAESYIAQQAASQEQAKAVGRTHEPFFLYLPLPSPHTPHVPRKPFVGKSNCGPYGDFVIEHDWSIGQVLDTLKRNGMADDTLVIITSDNGAHMRQDGKDGFDFHREFGHRSNHHFRGQKSDAWDGGHHVPFFAAWPKQISAGLMCHQTICLTDLIATCADITKQKLGDNAGEDSVSMLPLFQGKVDKPTRETVIHASITNRHAIRQGKWKFIEGPGSGGWSSPDGKVNADTPAFQLYDMGNDPQEQHNVFSKYPERVTAMQKLLNEQRNASRSVPMSE